MSFLHDINKVVIPAAGMGTRFLPVTKAVPKEMLPIAGRPLIQFAVEEAVASGLKEVIFVVSRGKEVLADYFQRDLALEHALQARGRHDDAKLIRSLSELAKIRTAYQEAPLGLAHAIGCAQHLVGDEPFAVILPDAIIDAPTPCLLQLLQCHSNHPGCVVATQQVDASEVDRFGILEVVPISDSCCEGRAMRVKSLVERPQAGSVPSRFGIFGRYILHPEIFRCIERTQRGFAGEFQLTDSLGLCSERVPLYAFKFEGNHYDAGNKLGFLQATLAYAMKDPDVARYLPLRTNASELNAVTASS